ncbi:hypothetical protein IWQ60_012081 [Tieghemiomyces parasiticus]|uniref:Uncharacterized protein n=1 Tax=Tieghemiomyces parasiticus TaxID=78921 RepID=A0A9W8DLP5_9FUNG|nr:hypothetical protein IWQ60_012081 [Tieghemiomyces parasiticus]
MSMESDHVVRGPFTSDTSLENEKIYETLICLDTLGDRDWYTADIQAKRQQWSSDLPVYHHLIGDAWEVYIQSMVLQAAQHALQKLEHESTDPPPSSLPVAHLDEEKKALQDATVAANHHLRDIKSYRREAWELRTVLAHGDFFRVADFLQHLAFDLFIIGRMMPRKARDGRWAHDDEGGDVNGTHPFDHLNLCALTSEACAKLAQLHPVSEDSDDDGIQLLHLIFFRNFLAPRLLALTHVSNQSIRTGRNPSTVIDNLEANRALFQTALRHGPVDLHFDPPPEVSMASEYFLMYRHNQDHVDEVLRSFLTFDPARPF